MTLLDDVVGQASEGEAVVVLRKLMIVAHRLQAVPLLAWVKNELNGYSSGDDLPTYRGPIHANVEAVITGPMGNRGTNTLSSHGVPSEFEGLFEVAFREPLASLEALAQSSDSAGIPWDPAMVGLYNQWIEEGKVPFLQYWGVYSARRMISQSTLQGVVDIVRTKALEMTLDPQAEFPDAGEVGGPTIEEPAVEATVTHITNNIYGNVNAMAQGQDVRQKVTVKTGDLVGALTAAKAFLADDAIAELSQVLTAAGDAAEKRGRLMRFVGAVKSGTVTLAGGVASNFAADGILEVGNQFFGWAMGSVS
ncbi:hypothetical protein [Brevibacterium aurantiacum]|uniref:AbiTii domain-containing protein n=1 Tax=Brevibacterium aurantiacum TaxID=273384 RepID=A0A2A3ZCP5_BREAU|nr:hypothetical protein [Brevibacterium aurantiacum]PCC49283.1 hypothetical protein CIK62_14370 [Brevibacterium aurantiacum]